jgi:parallel beta-helix repeat protein
MKNLWLMLLVLACPLAFGQNNVTTTNLTAGQRISASGATTVVPSGPIYDTTQLAGATIVARFNTCRGLLPATGGVCDMSAEAAATTAANLTLSTNGLTLILPPVKIGIGATFNIVISGNNNTVMCGGGSQTCVVNGAAAAVTNLIQITGNNNVIEGLQILGGRCGNNPCSGSAGSAANSENSIDITSAASGNRVLRNLITDSGKHGILIQNASNNLIRDNTIFRAYNEAILVNTSAWKLVRQ